MKVIRIINKLDFGGVEQRIFLTVEGLKFNSEIELIIIVLGKGGNIASKLKTLHPTVKIEILNKSLRIPNIFLIIKLFGMIKKIKPDVVHTSGAESNFHGLLAAKLCSVPFRIGEEIGYPNHGKKWRFVFRLTYLTCHKIIAISESVGKKIIFLGETDSSKVKVIYNPVRLDNNIKYKVLTKNESFTFITSCRLVKVKNIESLIFAFSDLIKNIDISENTLLWIVGDGPELQALKKIVHQLNLDKKVNFLGYQLDVFPFLKQADCFVLPSYSEGFSISLVEAMGVGLPSIVTSQGGPSEIVQPYKTGFLIDPYDVKDIQEKLEIIIKMSNKDRLNMGNEAMQSASKYSVERYISNIVDFYFEGR